MTTGSSSFFTAASTSPTWRAELPALGQVPVEARLAGRRRRVRAGAAGKPEQRQSGRDPQHAFGNQRAGHPSSPQGPGSDNAAKW